MLCGTSGGVPFLGVPDAIAPVPLRFTNNCRAAVKSDRGETEQMVPAGADPALQASGPARLGFRVKRVSDPRISLPAQSELSSRRASRPPAFIRRVIPTFAGRLHVLPWRLFAPVRFRLVDLVGRPGPDCPRP